MRLWTGTDWITVAALIVVAAILLVDRGCRGAW